MKNSLQILLCILFFISIDFINAQYTTFLGEFKLEKNIVDKEYQKYLGIGTASIKVNDQLIWQYQLSIYELLDVEILIYTRLINEDLILIKEFYPGTACEMGLKLFTISKGSVIKIYDNFGKCEMYEKVNIEDDTFNIMYNVRLQKKSLPLVTYKNGNLFTSEYSKSGKLIVKNKQKKFLRIIKFKNGFIDYKLADFEKYIDKHPDELIENQDIQNKLKKTLKMDFDKYVENIYISSGIELVNNYLIGIGQQKHGGGQEMSIICIDIISGVVYPILITNKKMYFYQGNDFFELPESLLEVAEKIMDNSNFQRRFYDR